MIINKNTAELNWDKSRWGNFSPKEFSCPCCGEIWWDESYFDGIQQIRTKLGRGVRINSAHRCRRHNAKVGGAPKSQHKKIALDFSMRGVKKSELPGLQKIMVEAGFTTFGCYRSFIHIDRRKGRFWIVKGGEKWKKYFRRIK